jgi:hypothetical protein
MPKIISKKTIDKAKNLLQEGTHVKDIAEITGISVDTVENIRDNEYYPHPPPIEQAIRMLECNKTHKQVEYQWGSEVLAEALTFHTIPTVEEYKEEYKL